MLTDRTQKILNFLGFVLALLIVNQIVGAGMRLSMGLYYAALIGLGGIVVLLSSPWKLNPRMFFLWGTMWLSILFNLDSIPPVYKAHYRTISFFLVMLSFGPFLLNQRLYYFRIKMLNFFNLFLLLLTLASLAGKFLGGGGSDIQGYYYGFSIHSMILGSVAGFTFINCLHEASGAGIPKIKILWIIVSVLALITGFYASSRVSLGASFCGAAVYLLKRYQGQYGRAILICGLLAIGLVFCLQFTGDILSGVQNKMGGRFDISSTFSSRQPKWEDRFAEFQHSPLFGVGAHSIHPEVAKDLEGLYTGMVEPGNAWLFFLSSMGILGFVAFCLVFLPPMAQLWKRGVPQSDGTLLLAQMVFFAVYMNAEAHITASGDYTYAYSWLIIALVQNENRQYLWESHLSFMKTMPFFKRTR